MTQRRQTHVYKMMLQETPHPWCDTPIWILSAACKFVIKLHQACGLHWIEHKVYQIEVYENHAWCKTIFADFLQVIETVLLQLCGNNTLTYYCNCGKTSCGKKSWQLTWNKPVDNLQQTSYHQTEASDTNPSWYRSHDCKETSLQQTCCLLVFFAVYL